MKLSNGARKAYDGIYNRLIKRILDLVTAVLLFIPVLPLYLAISVAIPEQDDAGFMGVSVFGDDTGNSVAISAITIDDAGTRHFTFVLPEEDVNISIGWTT